MTNSTGLEVPLVMYPERPDGVVAEIPQLWYEGQFAAIVGDDLRVGDFSLTV